MKRTLLDSSFLFILLFAVGSAVAAYFLHGAERFWEVLGAESILLVQILPVLAGALLFGGLLHVLVPAEAAKRWFGENSGITGILLATAVGMLVPGGPITSFPIVLALVAAGADFGVLVAFITSWSVLALNRVIVWEVPLLGFEFAAIRFVASIPLPILAGLIARRLPIRLHPLPVERD